MSTLLIIRRIKDLTLIFTALNSPPILYISFTGIDNSPFRLLSFLEKVKYSLCPSSEYFYIRHSNKNSI